MRDAIVEGAPVIACLGETGRLAGGVSGDIVTSVDAESRFPKRLLIAKPTIDPARETELTGFELYPLLLVPLEASSSESSLPSSEKVLRLPPGPVGLLVVVEVDALVDVASDGD